MKLTLNILVYLICLNVFSQQTKDHLIGKWSYIKTVNDNGIVINEVERSGNLVKTNGPEIIINENGTYHKKFTKENIDKGNWKLTSENNIEYEMIIPENSRQGKLILYTQQLIGKKWRKDYKGNFLDTSKDSILSINEKEMRIAFEKIYIQIFRKVVE